MTINIKDIEKMSNDELINTFEKVGIDYTNVSIEAVNRTVSGFTDEEKQKVERIQMIINTRIYDNLENKIDMSEAPERVEDYIKILSSDER